MTTINTVNGERRIADLGVIAPHEHIFMDMTNQYPGNKGVYGIDGDTAKVTLETVGMLRRNCYLLKDNLVLEGYDIQLRELEYYKRAGGGAMIEQTPANVGKDPLLLQRLSSQSGVELILSTGFLAADTFPAEYAGFSPEALAELFVKDLTEGIGDTGIKAGVIGELGTSEHILPVEAMQLRAGALAHRRTGAKISVHIYPWGYDAEEAIDLLEQGGVAPENICICHLDVMLDMDYIRRVLARGVYLEYDNFGKEFYIISDEGDFAGGSFATDIERVRTLRTLCEEGYAGRLLLTNDICLKSMLHAYGGWGYDHVLFNIAPMMANEGIDTALVRQMIEDNPKRFLAGSI